jgi:hypothetical protein
LGPLKERGAEHAKQGRDKFPGELLHPYRDLTVWRKVVNPRETQHKPGLKTAYEASRDMVAQLFCERTFF